MRELSLIILAFTFCTFSTPAQHLTGYNTGHIFHCFPNHKINQEGIDLFDSLSPDVLRFPGGSIGNKYHFNKTGYGWSKADTKQSQNYIVEYVRLVKAMKTKPKTVFVMNLLDHFKGADEAELIQENMDALNYLLDHDLEVIAVELGNEFYLYNEVIGIPGLTVNPELNNQSDNENKDTATSNNIFIKWYRSLKNKLFPKPKSSDNKEGPNIKKLNKFENLAKTYHDKIKLIDPEIRTGIPLGNFKNKKQTEYNTFVLEHFDFADAYVVHFYSSFNKNCQKGDFQCVQKGLDWHMREVMRPRLEYLKENSTKEIWVTEWNAIKFGHWGDESTWVRNSPTHIEHTKKYLETFKEFNVTISNYHKLAGAMKKAAYNAINVDELGKCHKTPIYHVLKEQYN